MWVVLKVLGTKGPLGIHFNKRGSQPKREPTLWSFLGQARFWDRHFEQLTSETTAYCDRAYANKEPEFVAHR